MSVEAGTPNVSVIVPIYNTKKYMTKCLDSLCVQTMKEIEVILIDDGSDDGSGEICDEYVQKDSRFRVFHKTHEGVAVARNAGLEKSRAKYIMFVDSDDWVEPDFCELPYITAEKTGADLVVFQRKRHEGDKAEIYAPYHYEGFISKEEALVKRWRVIDVIVMNKLFQRSLFDGMLFPEKRLSEDTAVMHWIVQSANSVYYLDKCLYHHLAGRPASITTARTTRMVIDEITFNVKRVLDLRRWGYECGEEERRVALRYLLMMGRKAELSSECDRVIRENSCGNYASWKQNVAAGLYRFSPGLFDLVSKLTGRRIRWHDCGNE